MYGYIAKMAVYKEAASSGDECSGGNVQEQRVCLYDNIKHLNAHKIQQPGHVDPETKP